MNLGYETNLSRWTTYNYKLELLKYWQQLLKYCRIIKILAELLKYCWHGWHLLHMIQNRNFFNEIHFLFLIFWPIFFNLRIWQRATVHCFDTEFFQIYTLVIYWPLTEPSIRDAPVQISGRKKRKQVGVMKEYRLVPVAVLFAGDRKARVRASWQTAMWPTATPGWATQAKMRKKCKVGSWR